MQLGTTVTLQEAADDELFFEIPDELLDTLGWEDGTVLQWEIGRAHV